MNTKVMAPIKILILGLFLFSLTMSAAEKGRNESRGLDLQKLTAGPAPIKTYLNINNISTVQWNNGWTDIDIQDQNAGFVFPKGSRKTCVFQTGFLWGAKVKGEVRVGGSAYRSGLQGGKIKADGTPEDPNLAKNRIYRVRPDYKTAKLIAEVNDGEGSEDAVRAQYEKDWNEWPSLDGAPYNDVNGNGVYEPTIDIPGVKGADQTIWYVANDLNSGNTTNLYGTNPVGMEMQATVWAYSQQGALGNMLFRKYLLINKGADSLKDMYVSQWSDIDDGNATDDYAGCDVTRSLGYTYNGQAVDAVYNPLPPPAVGFDFFQGPKVASAGSTATFGGKVVSGFKNLPMTAFYYFARGDATVTDPTQGDPEGAAQFYNFFQGKIGLTGNIFVDPNTLLPTTFALAGDPQTKKGWIDGQILPAGDRRQGLASGPFTMAPKDTQEIVVAEIAAGAIPGTDRLSAIGLLKFYDDQAQLAYNNFFDLPNPPSAPSIQVAELDKEIVLTWDNDRTAMTATENSNSKGYKFQGYNVYQLPSASSTIDNAKLIANFDVVDGIGKIQDQVFDPATGVVATKVRQFGNDLGIKRYLSITTDQLKGGTPLIDGIRYYFALTAYSYNPDPAAVPNNLEDPLSILTVVPHGLDPGYTVGASTGFKPTVIHPAPGIADAVITPIVVDPTKLTGAQYTLGWTTQPDKFTASFARTDTATVLMDGAITLSEDAKQISYSVKITNVDSLTGPIIASHFHTALGVVKSITFTTATVLGKKIATAAGVWSATDATQPLTAALVDSLINGKIYVNIHTAVNPNGEISATFGVSSYPWYLNRGTTKLLSYQQNYSLDSSYLTTDGIQLRVGNLTFASPITYFKSTQTVSVSPTDTNITLFGDGLLFGDATGLSSEFFGGGDAATNTDLVQDVLFKFTGVPADPNNPLESPIVSGGSWAKIRSRSAGAAAQYVRIPFEVWEVENNRQICVVITDRNVDAKSPWGDTGMPKWFRIRGRDYITLIALPYVNDTTQLPSSRADAKATWTVFFDGGENGNASKWHTGDQFRIYYANPVIPGIDTYTFTAPTAMSYAASKAMDDVAKINVFPNPYYGVNTEELNKYQRFVTFNHLPAQATIRIFNLGGVMVRKIEHNANSQFERWDLANSSGLPVASGLYIAYIDMGSLGLGTKIVKISIIQERQVLDRF